MQHAWHMCGAGCIVFSENPQGFVTRSLCLIVRHGRLNHGGDKKCNHQNLVQRLWTSTLATWTLVNVESYLFVYSVNGLWNGNEKIRAISGSLQVWNEEQSNYRVCKRVLVAVMSSDSRNLAFRIVRGLPFGYLGRAYLFIGVAGYFTMWNVCKVIREVYAIFASCSKTEC